MVEQEPPSSNLMAPPPLPVEPRAETRPETLPSTDVSPAPSMQPPLADLSEPGIELPIEPAQEPPTPPPVTAMAAPATALEAPAALTPAFEPEPEKAQRPSEEKSIEIDAESGLILPTLSALLGLDADALDVMSEPGGIEALGEPGVVNLLPNAPPDTPTPVRPQAPPPPLNDPAGADMNMTIAQGSSPEGMTALGGPPAEDPDAELHAKWEESFDFEAGEDEGEELMVLGGGGGDIAQENLSATRMEAPPSDEDDFGDFVELTDEDDKDDTASSTETAPETEENEEDGEKPAKKLSKGNLAAALLLFCGLGAGSYFIFFSGPGFETPTVKLAQTYLSESSDVVVGIDYAKLRTSRIYGKVRSPLENTVQTIRLFHKKGIVSPADVSEAVIGLQGEGDAIRYAVAMQGQFDASGVKAGLKDTFSWGDPDRERQISGTSFHGNPYEVGLTENGDMLFMSQRALTEKAMQIKTAGAGNFLKREKFERALKMVQTDGTVWAVFAVTPWLMRVVGQWVELPMNMISTGDVMAFSIDTQDGISIHLAAIFNDEEQVVIIEDFVNTLEDRMSPIVSADDFDKEDKGALMEVVKSRRFKRENDSLQFSVKASDEVLDTYFEPVYQMVMGLIEAYHAKMKRKGV